MSGHEAEGNIGASQMRRWGWGREGEEQVGYLFHTIALGTPIARAAGLLHHVLPALLATAT